MEQLFVSQRIVDMSEPLLAEDSTYKTQALSLTAVVQQLILKNEELTHHDYLVALLLVLLAETGFYTISSSDEDHQIGGKRSFYKMFQQTIIYQNTRLIKVPLHWKLPETGVYEIRLGLRKSSIEAKLIAIPLGDKLIVNLFACTKEKCTYSMVVQGLKYMILSSTMPYVRYTNIKQISHEFKNKLATPVCTDILHESQIINPSLHGLPLELQYKIIDSLDLANLKNLSLCSNHFSGLCEDKIFHSTFTKRVTIRPFNIIKANQLSRFAPDYMENKIPTEENYASEVGGL